MYFVIPHPYFLPAVYIALKSEASVFGFREDAAVRRIHVLHVTSNGLLATSVSSGHRTLLLFFHSDIAALKAWNWQSSWTEVIGSWHIFIEDNGKVDKWRMLEERNSVWAQNKKENRYLKNEI